MKRHNYTKALSNAENAYNEIVKKKEKYGLFHKCVFHIHTPESHDYRLIVKKVATWYSNCSDVDIYNICIQNNVFPKDLPIEIFDDKDQFSIFKNRKECLSYLLMAKKIIENNISLAVVTDHNTIYGVDKLKQAVNIIVKGRIVDFYPEIILGIEFSCADKNHVVGIFQDTKENKSAINLWLEENLLNVKEGTFRTSIDVLEQIRKWDGIGYIAHIDTSNVFKESHLSGAYKKRLFNLSGFEVVGVSDISKIDFIDSKMKEYTNKPYCYVTDCDAHTIDELNEKHIWLKGSKRNFSMIRDALKDYDISVSLKEPKNLNQYIKGIYIDITNRGFLKSQNEQSFCVSFSESLNCIIGGRGTGKSTVLQVLEFALRQKCDNERILDFICKHNWIWILYSYHNKEYLIHLNLPQKVDNAEHILQYFSRDKSYRYGRRFNFDQNIIENITLKEYLEIYEVDFRDEGLYLAKVSTKIELLRKFFDVRYSINELVQTASSDEINRFLYNKLFENVVLSTAASSIRVRSKNGLKLLLNDVENFLKKRYTDVTDVVDKFNKSQKGILRIIYSQNGYAEAIDFNKLILRDRRSKTKYYDNKNILVENIAEYLLKLNDKIGLTSLLLWAFDGKYASINQEVPIREFLEIRNQTLIEEGIIFIRDIQEMGLIEDIMKSFISDNNISDIIDYYKGYVTNIETYSLEFNVNSKESSEGISLLFKDIRMLSLGQKVVAMLAFILGFSDFSNDFRPLIIDQPEDNLDNQYIYKNLVKQLREIKSKRQVIVATHNATIVTNAKAEQVIVMDSDNEKGWIKTTGYPTETRMKKHIVNYLEGGIDSFRHKCYIYEDVIKKYI